MSGSIGANRIPRAAVEATFKSYIDKVLKKFPGFKSAKISGSYNTTVKPDHGDIDLVINIEGDEQDKKILKQKFASFISSLSDDVTVPFTSGRHTGKKAAGTGDIVIVQFPIEGYPDLTVQIDNMIVTSETESEYRKSFLDLPAEKQGLLVGLAKAILLEEDPEAIFKRLGIKNLKPLEKNQEYEFNLSNKGLTLRLVTLGDDFKELNREEIWTSFNWSDVEKLFQNFNLSGSWEDLLDDINSKLKNPRSKKRVKGVFNSLVVINAGEAGTPKGDNKLAAKAKVDSTLSEMKLNLGQYLAKLILEAEYQPTEPTNTIALFPGAFKPPHKGHFDVVEKLLKAADQVVVLVSPKTRESITAEESVAVWELYKPLFDGPVEIKVSEVTPVKEVYDVVEHNPDTEFLVAFGKGEIDRYKNIEKYSNVKIFDAGEVEGVSATNLRMALLKDNKDEIKEYLPENISVDEFLQALGKQPKEEKPEEVTPPPTETPTETPPPTETPEQPLQESPPVNFDEPPYQDYVASNRRKIEQAAAKFNVPIDDMEFAFNGGTEVVLNDDMWKEMENTKSYNTKTLSDAISHALKIGIDPKPYIDAIKKQEDIPLPLVLQWQQGKYYLVGGEVILSIYRSLGVIPTVLLGTLNLQTKTLSEPIHEGKEDDRSKTIKKFVKYAINELGIKQPPSGLTLSSDNEFAKGQHTFGTFNPNNDKIWVYVKNRNMADILRTLAHELVHRKQAEDNRLEPNSGETGSDIENEANAMAGVLLRKFGKNNENIYEGLEKFNTPVTLSGRLHSQLYELKVNEITLNPSNAVEVHGDLTNGDFTVGEHDYNYRIIKMDKNPYDSDSFYNIDFHEIGNTNFNTSLPTKRAKEKYIKILSTLYKIIVDFAESEKPEYIGISSLDKSGYGHIYNNLTKTNKIPGYSRKDAGLDFTTKSGDKGKFVVLKKNNKA